jgi:hypothetical protein
MRSPSARTGGPEADAIGALLQQEFQPLQQIGIAASRQAVQRIEADRAETCRARILDRGGELGLNQPTLQKRLGRAFEIEHREPRAVEAEIGETGDFLGTVLAHRQLDHELALPSAAQEEMP